MMSQTAILLEIVTLATSHLTYPLNPLAKLRVPLQLASHRKRINFVHCELTEDSQPPVVSLTLLSIGKMIIIADFYNPTTEERHESHLFWKPILNNRILHMFSALRTENVHMHHIITFEDGQREEGDAIK